MWLIKTIKNRVVQYPHIKLLFIFNLPIYVEFLTAYVIDPQCNYETSFSGIVLLPFLATIQYFPIRAILVKMRYTQKSLWQEKYQAVVFKNNRISTIMQNPMPDWLVDLYEDC